MVFVQPFFTYFNFLKIMIQLRFLRGWIRIRSIKKGPDPVLHIAFNPYTLSCCAYYLKDVPRFVISPYFGMKAIPAAVTLKLSKYCIQ